MTELEKAVEAYIENPANYLAYHKEWEDLSDLEYVEKAFKDGAEWQYEQFEKNRLTACDNMTKEEADREQEFTIDFIEKNHRIPTYSDAIEYGRKAMREKAISKLESLCKEWHLHESAEAKYRREVYSELINEFKEDRQ